MSNGNHGDALSEALRRLAVADRTMTASAAVEARLRIEVRAMGGRSQVWNRGTLLALAAAIVTCVSVPILWWRAQGQTSSTSVVTMSVPIERETTTEFFPLFYGSLPLASGHIVRMEVPRASLARFGLASAHDMDRTTGTVTADVLIGEDGLARAVRFVRPISRE
jgi:hypothetical protein